MFFGPGRRRFHRSTSRSQQFVRRVLHIGSLRGLNGDGRGFAAAGIVEKTSHEFLLALESSIGGSMFPDPWSAGRLSSKKFPQRRSSSFIPSSIRAKSRIFFGITIRPLLSMRTTAFTVADWQSGRESPLHFANQGVRHCHHPPIRLPSARAWQVASHSTLSTRPSGMPWPPLMALS